MKRKAHIYKVQISNRRTGFICILFLCLLTASTVLGQEQIDNDTGRDSISSLYYTDYSNLLAIRLLTITKWNTLVIVNDKSEMRFKPNSPSSLGVGFNYKAFGLTLAIGLPKSESSYAKFGQTKRLDVQMNMYGKKMGFDGFRQLYKSYYNANPDDFIEWDGEEYPVLADMSVLSMGVKGFYLFNSDKFSYKAAFVRNQLQLKSAGSFNLGAFANVDLVETDNGFIPMEIPDSLLLEFDLKTYNTIAIGVSFGYLYTWVISKNFFLNIGLSPGLGYQAIEVENIDGEKTTKHSAAAQVSTRSSLGYDTELFYIGMTGAFVWRNVEYRGYELDLATQQFKFFIGMRF